MTAQKGISRVGVVGCGQMGSGIAQVCAQSGYQVLVSEANEALLHKELNAINSSLEKAVQKGKLAPDQKDAIKARIRGTTDLPQFHDCSLVIEAVTEDLSLKKKIFQALDKICAKDAILASNTSCLPVSEMGAVTGRPDRVLGLHFFNPVPVMKLLEIVRTEATSPLTLEAARSFGASLGKTVIIARDTPGFIVNRLMVPQILIAIQMLASGLATREDIDTGLTLGLNHPLGPLALADLIGLDTLLFIADGIHERSCDERYRAPALLKEMVAAGRLGRKTGRGFYDYQ